MFPWWDWSCIFTRNSAQLMWLLLVESGTELLLDVWAPRSISKSPISHVETTSTSWPQLGPKLRLMAIFYPVQSPDVWTPQPSLTYTAQLILCIILGILPLVGCLEGSLTFFWRVDKEQFMSREDRGNLPTGLSMSAWCPWNQLCLHKTVLEPILQRAHPMQKSQGQVVCGKQM